MIFQKDLLKGHVALITGGGTGIGFGIASALTECGADVAIASRNLDHLQPAVEKLSSGGARAYAIQTNVRDPESVKTMVERTIEEYGRIDTLVNNAAGNFYAPSAELSPNGWRAVVETDLYGTFFCSQAVYAPMERQGGGQIISISMTLPYRGWPKMAHATAAKAGVDALTKTLAREWAPQNITVNAIAPGPMPTEGATKAFATGDDDTVSIDQKLRRYIPLGRWGSADDIGSMAVYLASPAASWITGAIFVVDGGSSLSAT